MTSCRGRGRSLHAPPPWHHCSRCAQEAGTDVLTQLWRVFGDILACDGCCVQLGSQNTGGDPGRPACGPLCKPGASTNGRANSAQSLFGGHRLNLTFLACISNTSPRIDVNEVPHGAHVTRLIRRWGPCRRNGCCSARTSAPGAAAVSALGADVTACGRTAQAACASGLHERKKTAWCVEAFLCKRRGAGARTGLRQRSVLRRRPQGAVACSWLFRA